MEEREAMNDEHLKGIILLVGVTGAGKSYFLNKLIGDEIVREGHNINSGPYRPYRKSAPLT